MTPDDFAAALEQELQRRGIAFRQSDLLALVAEPGR